MPNPRRNDSRRSDTRRTDQRRDAGAYIGRLPERAPEPATTPEGQRPGPTERNDAPSEAGPSR